MGISFQTARRWRKKFVRGANQGGRPGPEACITTGFIVLLEKEIVFVYVVLEAVQTGVISIVVVVFVHFVAKYFFWHIFND